jgi:hypothetical protein
VEDGFDRAFRNTRFAVDAFFRVNVEHLLPFVEALYRANDYTISVLAGETRFANDVRHDSFLLFLSLSLWCACLNGIPSRSIRSASRSKHLWNQGMIQIIGGRRTSSYAETTFAASFPP